nr:MAG TPA: hypothetical protein [Caudoviricetes sp.]
MLEIESKSIGRSESKPIENTFSSERRKSK